VLITGGTGVLGSALLPHLVDGGYTTRILSRSARKPGYDAAIEWARAEIETGSGLAAAVQDVDIIIHAASSPFKPKEVDVQGTAKLLQQAEAAGVQHFVYISIVGIEHIPFPYYIAKLAAEQVVENSRLPWTILRATQFHDLMVKMFLLPVIKMPLVALLPKGFKFQLIDEREVAVRLAEIVRDGPGGRVADIGGPEVLTLGEIAQGWLKATGKRRLVINLPLWGKIAQGFRRGDNTTPQNRYGKITWDEWLQHTYGRKATNHTEAAQQTVPGGAS
jgi:uncharacterized protein YbjT (DUF2867 family)